MTTSDKAATLMMFGDVARQWLPRIRDRFPELDVLEGSERDEDNARYADVDILVGWKFPPSIFSGMPKLRWVHSIAAGVEGWIDDPALPDSILVTNTKGVHADTIAEYVIWALISISRGFHRHVQNQKRRRWVQESGFGLAGKHLAIAGMGSIGQAVAARATVFGMHTAGIVRSTTNEAARSAVHETILFTDALQHAGNIDALVICLPLTTETRGLFGEQFVKRMKKDAMIVNVARAEITDNDCIADAVAAGNLAGAALDVFEKEPLSRWSRLWRVPNLLVTPHVSAMSPDYGDGVAGLLEDNIRNFLEQRSLKNLVDREKGY